MIIIEKCYGCIDEQFYEYDDELVNKGIYDLDVNILNNAKKVYDEYHNK